MTRKLILALATIVASFIAVAVVSAQDGTPVPYPSDDDVNRVAKQLYCPVCPNTPLDVCETKACQDWRAQIKDQLAAGWTDEQVIQYFVAQYGERVLAEPRRSGFTFVIGTLIAAWASLDDERAASYVLRPAAPVAHGRSASQIAGSGR